MQIRDQLVALSRAFRRESPLDDSFEFVTERIGRRNLNGDRRRSYGVGRGGGYVPADVPLVDVE